MADLPAPSVSAEEVRRVTTEVLSRAEFAEATPSWWDRVLAAVWRFFADLFAAISAGGRGSVIGTLVLVAAVLALAAAVIRYTSTLRRDRVMPVALDAQVGRSAREWDAEAASYEQVGAWREAVRCRYRGLLAELAAAGLVDEVAGRTSGEYRTAVEADVPRAAAAFTDATRIFDVAWYGHEPVSSAEAQALREAADRALRGADIRTPATAHR